MASVNDTTRTGDHGGASCYISADIQAGGAVLHTRKIGSARGTAILCFGDENTHGGRAGRTSTAHQRYRGQIRWPGALAAHLGSEVRVVEEGLPGRTTVHDDPVGGAHKNGLAILPALLESHQPIDVVFVMLGTNDLKPRFSVTPGEIAESVERLAMTVAASRANGTGVAPQCVVIAPPPIDPRGELREVFGDAAEASHALAHHLSAAAERVGAGFIDAGAHATVDPVDGVHLTEAGHAALAAALAKYARTHLLDACRPSPSLSRVRVR